MNASTDQEMADLIKHAEENNLPVFRLNLNDISEEEVEQSAQSLEIAYQEDQHIDLSRR